jgi:hypothetical protein
LGQRGHSEAEIALAVPAPELMQPQPSLRVVQKSIVWRQHMGEHTGERKCEVLGRRGLSEAIFAPAVSAWHRTVHRKVNCRDYGILRSSKIVKLRNLRTYVHRAVHRPDFSI